MPALEVLLALAFFAAGIAVMWYGFAEFHQGMHFDVAEYFGLALVLFGACFDPVNSLCMCMPWIWAQVAVSPPFKKVGWYFWGVGFLVIAAGWVGKHF